MKINLKLAEKKNEGRDVISFYFEPNPHVNFLAGQFLRYSINAPSSDERGLNRFFTISSSPNEAQIMLTTRFSIPSSSFKKNLATLPLGTVVEAEGPMGDFTYPDPSQEAVFIAGGIGITPFRSILVDLDSKNFQPKITLLYANRDSDIAFKDLFNSLARKNPNLKIVYIVSQPDPAWPGEKGKIEGSLIKKYITNLQTTLFYVSGPQTMVDGVIDALKIIGIKETKIKHDFFLGYDEI